MKEYNMRVEIRGYDVSKTKAILDTFTDEWEHDDECDGQLNLTADGILVSARESEEEITKRLSFAVWAANGKYCKVSIEIEDTDLDPYETYSLDEGDFERLKAKIEEGADMAATNPK